MRFKQQRANIKSALIYVKDLLVSKAIKYTPNFSKYVPQIVHDALDEVGLFLFILMVFGAIASGCTFFLLLILLNVLIGG
jgi:hypothetical protein